MNISVYHNSHEKFYRNPFGAVTCDTEIILRLKVESKSNISVKVVLNLSQDEKFNIEYMDIEEENKQEKIYILKYISPFFPCLINYYFILEVQDEVFYYGNKTDNLGGEGILSKDKVKSYQITNYYYQKVPDWYKESTMYQIFPDRFNMSISYFNMDNYHKGSLIHTDWFDTPFYIKDKKGKVIKWDFFGGNLRGIKEKLDYLKELNISVIYLNPIFEAKSNHKYDTANYKKIDKAFGVEKELKDLILEANNRGINIILDGVFSHTGSDSIYFNKYNTYNSIGAYQSKESPYYSWYKFINYPDKYESWWGIDSLPNVNELNPSYIEYMITGKDSVIKKWLRLGVKGFRLDVADELPDEFIKLLKKTVKEIDKEAVIIGEVWEDASNKISYGKLRQYFWGEELDSVMNYPFRDIFIGFMIGFCNGKEVHRRVMSLFENYPQENFYACMNILGTHDTKRILTILGESPDENLLSECEKKDFKLNDDKKILAIKRLKLISLIQFTFPGVPCIYYGDEAGVEGYADPYNRKTYPWNRENKDIVNWYKKISSIRCNYDSLKKGTFLPYIYSDNIYSYIRLYKNEKILCIFNRNSQESYIINIEFTNKVFDILDNKYLYNSNIKLSPLNGKLLVLE